jgi:hypothetical protein
MSPVTPKGPPVRQVKSEEDVKWAAGERRCGRVSFPLPLIQAHLPPFVANVTVPTTATVGHTLEFKVRVSSRLSSSERLRVTTSLSESFLVSGTTSAVLEVSVYCVCV